MLTKTNCLLNIIENANPWKELVTTKRELYISFKKQGIDGKAIVDNDGSHNARIAKGKVALDAGFHELRVLYFEDYMGEALEVGVSSRKIKEAVLPEDWYYLPE